MVVKVVVLAFMFANTEQGGELRGNLEDKNANYNARKTVGFLSRNGSACDYCPL